METNYSTLFFFLISLIGMVLSYEVLDSIKFYENEDDYCHIWLNSTLSNCQASINKMLYTTNIEDPKEVGKLFVNCICGKNSGELNEISVLADTCYDHLLEEESINVDYENPAAIYAKACQCENPIDALLHISDYRNYFKNHKCGSKKITKEKTPVSDKKDDEKDKTNNNKNEKTNTKGKEGEVDNTTTEETNNNNVNNNTNNNNNIANNNNINSDTNTQTTENNNNEDVPFSFENPGK